MWRCEDNATVPWYQGRVVVARYSYRVRCAAGETTPPQFIRTGFASFTAGAPVTWVSSDAVVPTEVALKRLMDSPPESAVHAGIAVVDGLHSGLPCNNVGDLRR